MNMLMNFVLALQILAALTMIGLVLIQHGKGADMGASFGSGASGKPVRRDRQREFPVALDGRLRRGVLRLHARPRVFHQRAPALERRQRPRPAERLRIGAGARRVRRGGLAGHGRRQRRGTGRTRDRRRAVVGPGTAYASIVGWSDPAEIACASARIHGCPVSHSSCQPKQRHTSAADVVKLVDTLS